MSIEIGSVSRTRVVQESSFANDETGTLGNFVDVPFIEGSLTMVNDREMLNPEHAQQKKDGYPTQLRGLKACTLTYGMNLASTGVPAVSATTAVQGALGLILSTVMGGENLDEGSTVDSAGTGYTETAFEAVVDGTMTRGTAVGVVNAAGDLEARPIANTDGPGVTTLRMALSATATTGAVLYRSATYYMTEDPASSLQHLIQYAESDAAWLQVGMQLESMALDTQVGQLPRITFGYKGADYLTNTATAGTITGGLTAATYTNVSPTHFVGAAYIADHTSTTPVELCVSSVTISPSIAYVPQTCPTGTQTVKRWVRDRAVPVVTGSFVVPFEDLSHYLDRDDGTLKQIIIQMGTAAGSTILLDFPQVQITNVQLAGGDSILSSTVEFAAQCDSVTSGAGDLSTTAFRIHLL